MPAGPKPDVQQQFHNHGYFLLKRIGQGMEGVVYQLHGGLVGKVWFKRTPVELQSLQRFYHDLDAQALPFATPHILEIIATDDSVVTIERELTGTSMQEAMRSGECPPERALQIVREILMALQETRATSAAKQLPVLGERIPLWQDKPSWGDALAALVGRRAARFGKLLREAVTDFDAKLEQTVHLLRQLPHMNTYQIIHGDIGSENVLLDEKGKITALLDWGFLSTAGDSAFDAATAAGFLDMYGADARVVDDALLDDAVRCLGYSPARLLLYRAAYAIAGANAYADDGSDGHFAWCVATLHRQDISELLATA